ncbi:MAG: SDR family oxidoreductase [Anaerolineae bacterium]|nr:SDR family oxidoreductase [Anaerolineae bacterium]
MTDIKTHSLIAVVTGAASGIGYALSKALLKRGIFVYCVDNNNELEKRITPLGQMTQTRLMDVRDFDAWEKLLAEIIVAHGHIDYLFNNAGIGYGCDSVNLEREHYDRYIDINIRGVTNAISLIYPQMIRQGNGTIVNTASVGGLIPSALMTPYAMSKHAIYGLSESLRLEAALKGVRVITLCPGAVDTPIFDSVAPGDIKPIKSTRLREYTQEKRVSISADKFAELALNDITKNKSPIIYPRSFRLLVFIYRFMPALYRLITAKNLRDEMQRLNSPLPSDSLIE